MSDTAAPENPLVPNKKLREIYLAMVEVRLLDDYIVDLERRMKPRNRMRSTRGQEACRVSTAVELKPDDLISDNARESATMSLLFGAKPDALFRYYAANASGTKEQAKKPIGETASKRQLPWIDDVSDRLKLALGATLTFKTLKHPNIVVAYVSRAEVPQETWKNVLALAGQMTLPIIFVVLPDEYRRQHRTDDLCAMARTAGIPGIPVDANDAVALYRVFQESIGRTRGGDGAVLIDCISTKWSEGSDDPVVHMKEFLVGRKICTEAWANRADTAFRKKIARHLSSLK